MEEKFKVTDPRGREISCSEECWGQHVLKARPTMAGEENHVKKTLAEPDGIANDVAFTDRHCYYKLMPHKKFYMKVVVEFDADDVGSVKTAFPTNSPKKGEVFVWMPH